MQHNKTKFEMLFLTFEESHESEWIRESLAYKQHCENKIWKFHLMLSSMCLAQ